jgi:predicted metal-binding membrane protein
VRVVQPLLATSITEDRHDLPKDRKREDSHPEPGHMSNAGGIKRSGAERTVVLTLLGLLAALCWAYLLYHVGRLAPIGTGAPGKTAAAPYHAHDLGMLFALWVVVIAAMMLPAAAPSVLLYARVKRLRRERWIYAGILAFILGYLFVWCCCALAATLAAWILHDAGALDENMAISQPVAGALALVAVGVYQWTPAKHVCLDNCRTPLAFVLTHWRRGVWGAFRMGVTDARYCTGCCWLMMALVLPAGVFNLPVICGLIALILAEKLLPGGHLLACATGLGLVAWGTALLFP